jgi:hypothetical protein
LLRANMLFEQHVQVATAEDDVDKPTHTTAQFLRGLHRCGGCLVGEGVFEDQVEHVDVTRLPQQTQLAHRRRHDVGCVSRGGKQCTLCFAVNAERGAVSAHIGGNADRVLAAGKSSANGAADRQQVVTIQSARAHRDVAGSVDRLGPVIKLLAKRA